MVGRYAMSGVFRGINACDGRVLALCQHDEVQGLSV